MRHSKLLVWAVLGCLVFAVTAEAVQSKSETGKSGNKVGRFFRGLFKFPARTTDKSVGVATEAVKKGTAIGTGEVENVGKALTGNKKAAVDVVTEPVKGAATTTYDTTKGALMAPIEGAKEAAEKEHLGN